MRMFASTNRKFFQEWRRSLRGCRPRFSFGLMLFEEGFTFDFFGIFIPLLFLDRWRYETHEIMESWGFTACDRTIHLNWGSECKVVHMPWDFEHIKGEHKVLRPDGAWVPYVACYEEGPLRVVNDFGATFGGKEPDGRQIFTAPYHYTLKSGEVQERTATFYVERREWRWRCLQWLPFFGKKSKAIDITFDGEIGERTGSWKGGCIGTGYEMRKGETPLECLRRMEREREFR